MIKNEKQLGITLNSIKGFQAKQETLGLIDNPNDMIKCEFGALKSMISDLESQVDLYYRIINKEIDFSTISSFEQISLYIIGKRMQLGINEEDMSKLLNMDIYEYMLLEEDEFYGIDVTLLNKIIGILSISIDDEVYSENILKKFGIVLMNLKKLKIKDSIIKQTLNVDIKEVLYSVKEKTYDSIYLVSRFVQRFKNIFGLNLIEEIREDSLSNSLSVAFKKPININNENLNIITGYAAYVSAIVLRQMQDTSILIEPDPIKIRKEILKKYSSLSIEACADYIWSNNICIIPLDIDSGFHGACFNFSGKKVIVLNQQNKMVSRWKFDLLHEFYHALTMQSEDVYIEPSDQDQQLISEEIKASQFANYVIFGSDAETYLQVAVDNSHNDIRLLKSNMIKASKDYHLNIDDFSNYAAYRLTMQGISWWGTANGLQLDRRNPFNIIMEFLLRKIDLNKLSEYERKLFITLKSMEE